MSTTLRDEANQRAILIVQDLLGIQVPEVGALIELANRTLGVQRTQRCQDLVRESPLTRRSYALSSLAALVVGTRQLGQGWWESLGHQSVKLGHQSELVTPDEALHSRRATPQGSWPTLLEALAERIASDAADALWGPPVAEVDLNSQASLNRFDLPPSAKAGDRLVAAFEPGSRLDAVVSLHEDGLLGSDLDLKSCRHSPPSEADWGWAIGSGLGPHPLPDEPPGSPRDPYAVEVNAGIASKLTKWAMDRGESAELIGHPWTTTGDAIRALEALYLDGRDGRWYDWGRAAKALADRDTQRLADAMARLRLT